MSPDVSVVVPVYRNAATLRELHRRLAAALLSAHRSFEIVFVDDACPAGSGQELERLVRADSRIAVLTLAHNLGQHRAVLAGLERCRGQWTVVMDADLQDPPECVPMLVEAAARGWDAVFAGRCGRYESLPRLLTSRLFKLALHLLCGVPRDAGMFVAMNRALVARLVSMPRDRAFLVAMIGCSGARVSSIPIARAPRTVGRSAYRGLARARSAWRAIAWVIGWRWHARARRRAVI